MMCTPRRASSQHSSPYKIKAPESALSGAVTVPGSDPLLLFGVVVGLLNSECPQQDCAYESEYGAHSQHIELQGKVHGSAYLVDALRLARNDPAPKAPVTIRRAESLTALARWTTG